MVNGEVSLVACASPSKVHWTIMGIAAVFAEVAFAPLPIEAVPLALVRLLAPFLFDLISFARGPASRGGRVLRDCLLRGP